MLTPHDLDPDELYPRLGADLQTLRAELDGAIDSGLRFFGDQPPFDPSLFPNLVRFFLLRRLQDHGVQAEQDDEVDDFAVQRLSNNGVLLRLLGGQVLVRVRLRDGGSMPAPGHSQALQTYYRQPSLFDVPDKDGVDCVHLVATWTYTSLGLVDLVLHCPRLGGHTRASVDEHWRRLVPDPLAQTQDESVAVEDVLVEDLDGDDVEQDVAGYDEPIREDEDGDEATGTGESP